MRIKPQRTQRISQGIAKIFYRSKLSQDSTIMLSRVLLILMCFCALSLNAQNDTENPPSTKYEVGFNLSGRYLSGTFTQTVFSAALNGDVENEKWHISNNLTYRYNITNGINIQNDWYNLFMANYFIGEQRHIFPGVFYHYDNNLIFRVNSRHRYGVGFGSIWDDWKNVYIRLDAGIGREHANFNGDMFANSDRDMPQRNSGLFLVRLINNFTLMEKKISFSYRLYYMQATKEAADYDIWILPKLSFRVVKNLSVSLSYDYRFENTHLEVLSPYNDMLLFGLTYKIKQ